MIAKDKKTYEIKYFNIQQDEAAEEWARPWLFKIFKLKLNDSEEFSLKMHNKYSMTILF